MATKKLKGFIFCEAAYFKNEKLRTLFVCEQFIIHSVSQAIMRSIGLDQVFFSFPATFFFKVNPHFVELLFCFCVKGTNLVKKFPETTAQTGHFVGGLFFFPAKTKPSFDQR